MTTKLILLSSIALTACSSGLSNQASGDGYHVPLQFIDGGVGAQGTVQAQVNVGTIYLEQQYAPPTVGGVALQASGVDVRGANIYISYSKRDTTGVVRQGAVQRFSPLTCDSLLTLYTDYCLVFGGTLNIPNANIYATATDGTNLYAVGTTADESTYPYFGRLFKISLSGTGDPQAITNTATLPSYTGTSVALSGTNVLTTYGTSLSSPMMGGFGTFSASTLSAVNSQSIYDARWIAVDPSNAAVSYVVTGAGNGFAAGRTLKLNSDASGTTLATLNTGGNTIAESRSTTIVGNSLVISTAGDGGLSVMCKATGALVTSKGAPTAVGSIPNANSVTNGIAAVPGYLFVANGEAGVYVYTFNKSSALNSNYCQGVTLSLVGRLALSADSTGNTYVNAELSANSIKPVTILNALNVVTSRLLVIASGNKGVSLLNVTNLNLGSLAVDDF